MRQVAVIVAAVFGVLSLAGAGSGAATPQRPDELHPGPLRFTPLHVEKAKLKCGIPVYLFENHDLPLLDLTIQFPMGERYVEVADQAAAGLLGTVWRSGGTSALSADSLDEALAAMDATISSMVGSRTGGVWLYSASEDMDRALPLWRDVVLKPRFDSDRLVQARANRLKDLQTINNDPEAAAGVYWNWLVWGRDYPGAHVETRSEIEAVTADRLRELHRRFVRPSQAVIGVSGDFDRPKLLKKLDQLFAGWPEAGPAAFPAKPAWTPHPAPHGVYVVKGDYEQSQVRLGRLLPDLTRDSPEYAAADILSFGFGYGRTFYHTRSEGLSYGAAVFLRVGDDGSTETGFGSCRPEVTGRLLGVFREELDRLAREPLTAEETERARVFLIGTKVRESETASRLVSRRVQSVCEGRPDDFPDRYLRQLQEVRAQDLPALAARYLTLGDSALVLVLGDPAKLDTPPDSLGTGPVTELAPVKFGE